MMNAMVRVKNVFLFLLLLVCCAGCSDDPVAISSEGSGGSGGATGPDTDLPEPHETMVIDLLADGSNSIPVGDNRTVSLNASLELTYSRVGVDYCDMGPMQGLGDITSIPAEGWTDAMPVKPGNGYLLRRWIGESCYARLYVTDYLTDSEGGIRGVRVCYQSPFQQVVRPKQESYTFVSDRSRQDIRFQYPTHVELVSVPDWCEVTQRYDGLTVWCMVNPTATVYEADLVLRNSEGEFRIPIRQLASDTPDFASGRGLISDPFQITEAAHLDAMRRWCNQTIQTHFTIENDIDLTSYLADREYGWNTIGFTSMPFYAYLDGKMHTIRGLWTNTLYDGDDGFLGVAKNSRIINLRIELGDKGMVFQRQGGGLCGYATEGTTISRCSVSGRIVSKSDYIAGGILGRSDNTVQVSECYTMGEIEGGVIGGICAYSKSGKPTITNCYSTVHLIATAARDYATARPSSVFGIAHGVTSCSYCYAAVTVKLPEDGPVASSGPVCYYKGTCCYYNKNDWRGSAEDPGLTTDEMKRQSSYEGWDFEHVWHIEEGVSYPTLRCFAR